MRLKEWMQCARKICHTDFWSAYQHKRGLQHLNPYADIDIYACDYCGGLHVGNQLTVMQAERSLKKLYRMMDHPNFERKAPPEVVKELTDKRDKLRNFLAIERARFEKREQAHMEMLAEDQVSDVPEEATGPWDADAQ